MTVCKPRHEPAGYDDFEVQTSGYVGSIVVGDENCGKATVAWLNLWSLLQWRLLTGFNTLKSPGTYCYGGFVEMDWKCPGNAKVNKLVCKLASGPKIVMVKQKDHIRKLL